MAEEKKPNLFKRIVGKIKCWYRSIKYDGARKCRRGGHNFREVTEGWGVDKKSMIPSHLGILVQCNRCDKTYFLRPQGVWHLK
jgi:hypothetical protein